MRAKAVSLEERGLQIAMSESEKVVGGKILHVTASPPPRILICQINQNLYNLHRHINTAFN